MRIYEAFADEFEKIATSVPGVVSSVKNLGMRAAKGIHAIEDPLEVGGLAFLAAPNVDNMVAKRRARKAGLADAHGHVSDENLDKFRVIKEKYHDPVEVGGLGVLAAPLIAKRIHTGSWMGH